MVKNLSTIEMVKSIKKCNSLVAMTMLCNANYNFKVGMEAQSNETADKVTSLLLDEVTTEVIIEVTIEAPQDEVTPQQDPIETPQDPKEAPQQDPTKQINKVQLKKIDDLTDALTIAYQRRSLKQAQTRTSARMALITIITQTTKMKPTDKRTAQIEQHIKDATSLNDLTAKVVSMMHPHHK